MPETYDGSKIQVLEGLEAVRKRPAMYIGDTFQRGLHHCVYEVVDNSIDEALAGYCTRIEVLLNADGSVSVSDNGRGIPVDLHPKLKKPAVEVVLTMLHAGGKFDHGSYKVSGGLHGVGVSCVNALSEWLEVEVRRDGKVYHQRFERGITKSPLEAIGTSTDRARRSRSFPTTRSSPRWNSRGTSWPTRLRELAFLNKGIEILLRQEQQDGRCARRSSATTGGIQRVRRAPEPEQERAASRGDLLREGAGRRRGRDRLQYTDGYTEIGPDLRQQHQHDRGRHAPERVPHRADARGQHVRPRPTSC